MGEKIGFPKIGRGPQWGIVFPKERCIVRNTTQFRQNRMGNKEVMKYEFILRYKNVLKVIKSL